jgi:hypothetical protein
MTQSKHKFALIGGNVFKWIYRMIDGDTAEAVSSLRHPKEI